MFNQDFSILENADSTPYVGFMGIVWKLVQMSIGIGPSILNK